MVAVLWLGDSDCHEVEVVGPKAANLSRLAAEHRVPAGFTITGLSAGTTAFAPEAAAAIAAAYQELAGLVGVPTPRVAVRSSAIDEDGANASFAGQHATFLNVQGDEAVLDAVLRCCASAGSESALAYRVARDVEADGDAAIAILVQHLVEADVAFVAFSANPVTGARGEVVINASWGLGESVVSGLVTPDMYVVAAAGDGAIDAWVAEKEVMTVLVDGGTEEAPVPDDRQALRCLDDAQVRDVAALAAALERTMGWPVDIEGAFAAGELYLLQCRPITTLPGLA